MSKIKNPQEKKRLHYDKDHVVCGGESQHAFRKNWPRKKARVNREYRRRADQFIKEAAQVAQEAVSGYEYTSEITREFLRKSVTRKRLLKWGVATVRQIVLWRLESRAHRHGAKKARRSRQNQQISNQNDS